MKYFASVVLKTLIFDLLIVCKKSGFFWVFMNIISAFSVEDVLF